MWTIIVHTANVQTSHQTKEVAIMRKKLSDMEQHYEARLRELQVCFWVCAQIVLNVYMSVVIYMCDVMCVGILILHRV